MTDSLRKSLDEADRIELSRAQELLSQVELLLDTVRDLTSTLAVQEVIERLVDRTLMHMRAGVAVLHTLEEGGVLRVALARGLSADIVKSSTLAVGEGIAGRVAESAQAELVECLAAVPTLPLAPHERAFRGAVVCAPIVFREAVWGVITVCSGEEDAAFGPDQGRLLGAIADHAAVALSNAERYERLLEMAQNDPLTGLSNHGHFWATLTAEMSRASRYERQLSVVMIDVDHFKSYNDTRGHMEGDLALVQVARCIEGRCRASDIAARYGGDEFAAILPETPAVGALSFGEKIRNGVAELDLQTGGGEVITVSVGVASYPGEGQTAKELVRSADEHLYRAKERGRNCVCGQGYESR